MRVNEGVLMLRIDMFQRKEARLIIDNVNARAIGLTIPPSLLRAD